MAAPHTASSPPDPHLRRLRNHLLNGQDRQALLLGQALTAQHPQMGEAWNLLGVAAQREGLLKLALTAKRKAAQLLPHRADVHINLANALRQHGELEEARASLDLALRLEPNDAAAHNLLGLVQQRQSHIQQAQQSFEAALKCDPNFVQAHSNLLFMLTHEGSLSPAELREAHLRFGAQHGAPLRSQWPQHANLRDPAKRLRVGFVSADLRNHAVARFIAPIWRAFDRRELELVAYQAHWRRDDYTAELQALCDQWSDVAALSDAELTARIQVDGIDILFDLSGHTAHNRLMCFARKPAPVQITAIGYPHSTGLDAVDYRITDAFRTPPELANQCVEHLVWIPSSSSFEHGAAPDVTPLPALSGQPFTFGSFQRPNKIGPASLDLWAAVLQAVPGSRLLMGAIDGGEARQRLQQALEARGISRTRLAFHGVQPLQQYLALHAHIDLLLDTVPYPAGTTAHHGLWMGVPTLTRTGDSFVSWQCAGILGRLGLQAFIAHDDATFVAMAKTWSQQLQSLGTLRTGLRARIGSHPLVQPATVAAGMQAALREMWRRWCAGLPAESFEVQLER